jgi:hypothetical protein
MRKIAFIFACLMCLSACNEPGTLQGHVALGAVHVDKREGPLGLTLEISTTVNLVEELHRIGAVTYGYLICPLSEKAIFYPQEEAGPALVAPVHELWLPKNVETRSVPGQKYQYQLAGEFLSTKTDRAGVPVPLTEIISSLKRRDSLSCKMIILRYFRAPYFSNTALLKTSDLIGELEKIH